MKWRQKGQTMEPSHRAKAGRQKSLSKPKARKGKLWAGEAALQVLAVSKKFLGHRRLPASFLIYPALRSQGKVKAHRAVPLSLVTKTIFARVMFQPDEQR